MSYKRILQIRKPDRITAATTFIVAGQNETEYQQYAEY
jgi:hypothetical protein